MTTILLDATALPKQPVGAGVYITNLVREILLYPSDLKFLVLSHRDDFSMFHLDDEYLERFIFLPDFGRGLRLLMEQLVFPRLIKKYRVDIFHGLHYSFPLQSPASIVTTVHDLSYFIYPQKHNWLKRLYFPFFIRSAGRKANQILTVSENTKLDLIKFTQCPEEKIFVTPLGVEDRYFALASLEKMDEIRNKYKLPENYILFVGLIEPRKSIPTLIRAFLQLNEDSIYDIHLVIAGRWGWESKSMLDEFVSHPAFQKIHFPGYIADEDLPALYQMASIFVYPSSYEGFGLPVLEAMASGLPVITTNISSMPEFVSKAGILFSADEPFGLIKSMKLLLNDREMRLDLGKRAKERAADYRWKSTAEKTIAAYHHLTERQGK